MPRFSLGMLLAIVTGFALLFAVMTPLFVMGVETKWLLILSVEAAFWVALLPCLWWLLQPKGPPPFDGDGDDDDGDPLP